MASKRYVIHVYLDSFYTEDCGDLFGEGEFYFTCNKVRFPAKGEIKLGKKEKFDPKPDPTIYFAIKETKADKTKIKLQVWEKDPGLDDKFIDEVIVIDLKDGETDYTIKNKKETCKLKIKIKIHETDIW